MYIASVEQGIKDLPNETKNEVRINIYSILKQARPPTKQNLTRGEKKAFSGSGVYNIYTVYTVFKLLSINNHPQSLLV